MLVKKNVLNEINKEGTALQFQGLQENQKESISKLTVKASSEKAWLLYEFSFSSDKPNDTQASKNYSSLYPVSTEDQFQANSKKH